MFKYAIPWQHPLGKRQVVNGTFLALLFLGIFFYISWNTLEATRNSHSTERIAPVSSDTQACPTLPEPTCPSPQPPPKCPPPPSPYDPKKLAFMVETRPLPHLPALFIHMASLIPPEWTFRFMGSPASIAHMQSSPAIARLEASKKLTIVPLPSNYSLQDRETISHMFTDSYLYTYHLQPAEHLLVFQPDAIFCANAPKTLNDYLQYDWIGAPWSKTAQWGGNGGLSLRRVSRILSVLQAEQRTTGHPELEDLWLTTRMSALPGANMPNATISKTFSVESVWDDSPLGYHVGWLGVHHEQIWDDEKQVEHVLSYCPEVKMVLGMKLAGDKPESVKKVEETVKEQQKPPP